MKFSLSTLLLLTTLVAISSAWWFERHNRYDITGEWEGYQTTLSISADGSFSKIQDRGGVVWSKFDGAYIVKGDGTFVFRVNKLTEKEGSTSAQYKLIEYQLDIEFEGRCGVDKTGCLVISCPFVRENDCDSKFGDFNQYNRRDIGIEWGPFTRAD